jgi:uncharacterized protein YraI
MRYQRVVLVLAMLAVMASAFVATVQPAEAAAGTTTANLNLRQGPGTSFAVQQVIPAGSTVEVTGSLEFGYLPVTYGAGSGWVLGSFVSTAATTETSGTRYVIDGRLNLRSGPGTSYPVTAVMPDGAAVALAGETSNEFVRIAWNGLSGWAAARYLATSASDTDPAPPAPPTIGDTPTGSATATARLYVRSGPGSTFGARTVVPTGSSVEVIGAARDSFTPIRHEGVTGWVASAFLTEAPPTVSKVTTAAVNLRTGPGTTFAAQRVLPPGTAVTVTGAEERGFLPVTWGTLTGYVSSAWLTDPGSAADPGASPEGNDDIIAIIYAAADRWGQPRADMLRVARCESNLDPVAVNPSSGASGLFQFMPSTFATTPNGQRGEDIFDASTSADAAGWMWANGRRNEWECQ